MDGHLHELDIAQCRQVLAILSQICEHVVEVLKHLSSIDVEKLVEKIESALESAKQEDYSRYVKALRTIRLLSKIIPILEALIRVVLLDVGINDALTREIKQTSIKARFEQLLQLYKQSRTTQREVENEEDTDNEECEGEDENHEDGESRDVEDESHLENTVGGDTADSTVTNVRESRGCGSGAGCSLTSTCCCSTHVNAVGEVVGGVERLEHGYSTCRFALLLLPVESYEEFARVVQGELLRFLKSVNASRSVIQSVESGNIPVIYVFTDSDTGRDIVLIRVEHVTYTRSFQHVEKSKSRKIEKVRKGDSTLDSIEDYHYPLAVVRIGELLERVGGVQLDFNVLKRLREKNVDVYRHVIDAVRTMVLLNPPPLPVEVFRSVVEKMFNVKIGVSSYA